MLVHQMADGRSGLAHRPTCDRGMHLVYDNRSVDPLVHNGVATT